MCNWAKKNYNCTITASDKRLHFWPDREQLGQLTMSDLWYRRVLCPYQGKWCWRTCRSTPLRQKSRSSDPWGLRRKRILPPEKENQRIDFYSKPECTVQNFMENFKINSIPNWSLLELNFIIIQWHTNSSLTERVFPTENIIEGRMEGKRTRERLRRMQLDWMMDYWWWIWKT